MWRTKDNVVGSFAVYLKILILRIVCLIKVVETRQGYNLLLLKKKPKKYSAKEIRREKQR